MCVLIVLVYFALGAYEFTPLYKQKFWKDMYTNSVLFIFSFIIAILICFGIPIPSPVTPIKNLIISLFGE